MARLLFTMHIANDLGLPSRMVPIARELADRGHTVAVCNPSPAPARLIEDMELVNLPLPPLPKPALPERTAGRFRDVDEFWASRGMLDEAYVRALTAGYVEVIRTWEADLVIDSFSPYACLAARASRKRLVTVLQGDFHSASRGFLWWEGAPPPADGPSAAPVMNAVAASYGLEPLARVVDLFAGDLDLIAGTPGTDPLPPSARVTYVGPILWERGAQSLPDWAEALRRAEPVIWVYSGNPRYGGTPFWSDSVVVIHAAIAAFADLRAQVVLTTGHQPLPEEVGALPENFRHAGYVPGVAMARRSDLMVHHGGHGSFQTGLFTGTPAVIIPTYSERESNARRNTALGAGEFVVPTVDASGEKHVDAAEFGAKVRRVLTEPAYRQAAQRVAASMARYGGAREAADHVERFIEGG